MSKVVVITGANSGIGLAAAKLYESNGYFVVLGCKFSVFSVLKYVAWSDCK